LKEAKKKPRRELSQDEVTQLLRHHALLRWFAVISMLAVASWIVIALFGPIPKYEFQERPRAAIESQEFLAELQALTDARIVPDAHIQDLANGHKFYQAELNAIASAQKSIDWEAYIFQKGEIARQIVAALTERAKAGVKVNLVLDSVGSLLTPKSFFDGLRRAGGHVSWYHPVRWYTWPRANNRTHRELIVIDGKLAFVGGAGVADHWWKGKNSDPAWRDTMFAVTGEAAQALQGVFAENWLESSGQILFGDKYFADPPKPDNSGGTSALVVGSSPSEGGSTRTRILFQTLIASAQKSLKITTPYFLPDQSLRKEMVRAIQERHVQVQILVPGKHSDHSMTRSSSRGTYGDLLRAGAEIYEYSPAMLHAKIMVVDDAWCVVGSTNMDHRSFGLNDEVNLATLDRALAADLNADFQGDLAQARRITLEEWEHRPMWEKAMEWLGWIIAREQ
jgi:cardiolipin synthase